MSAHVLRENPYDHWKTTEPDELDPRRNPPDKRDPPPCIHGLRWACPTCPKDSAG